jgi:hypothetical protein
MARHSESDHSTVYAVINHIASSLSVSGSASC